MSKTQPNCVIESEIKYDDISAARATRRQVWSFVLLSTPTLKTPAVKQQDSGSAIEFQRVLFFTAKYAARITV